ncbi:MAG: DUF2726 domain-containing protein [Acidiferrobacterales bacterium]|nr:DUF2726 domain-containing protein [Acidiferrobacterales bacterium]
MKPELLLIALVALGVLIWVFRPKSKPLPGGDLPYQRQLYLFSKTERAFHRVLEKVNDDRAVILGKVCVGDVITPKRSLSRNERQSYLEKISSRRFDFVLCSKKDLSVLCAIDLVDVTKNSEARSERQAFLEQVCLAADVPLLQVTARTQYDFSRIEKIFRRFVPKEEEEKDEIYLWTQLQIDADKE